MSDKPMNKSRRDAVKMMLGGLASVPLVNLVGIAAAQAQDLPHVDPGTDPTAQALKYSEDATQADRAAAARPGKPPEEQFCNNCQFVLADSGEWRPCSLFPGKAVHETGWCASWTLKAG
ncbi:iron permease [Lamprobacter modestohalophilus]|uniref:High-potential iron-sulfur protein n=1 Tax=Lamprobacter modestohalophilus TaxID=1064514 RepID=A0A9X1B3J1_9GAMM|nr:high-potential iron-sulfur protein [Lamprobacter modestohalophilus]MBK1618523.1 iron permease [Lamprobacter modestohalophilus]